jgi:hypothetical protein
MTRRPARVSLECSGITEDQTQSLCWELDTYRSATMTELDCVTTTKRPTQVPIVASHDQDRQDPSDRRTLYVLGFGIAGAILANSLLLVYFASLYASG